MANLKYRGNTTTPTKPTSTTAKNAPLTNDEIDGNLRSLNDSKLENSGWTPGDIFYANASGNLVRLPIGSSGQLLTPTAGLPTWQPSSAILDTINVQEFSSAGSSTWVKPAGAKYVHIIMYGAGSSGVGGYAYSSINSTKAHPGGMGGQGGSRVELWVDASSLSSSVSLTVGAGGGAMAADVYNNAGGSSNFGSFVANGAASVYGEQNGFPYSSGFSKKYYPASVLSSVYGYFSGSTMSYLMPYGGGIYSYTSNSVVIASAMPGGMGALTGGGGGGGGGINSNSTWSVGSDGGLGGGALFYSTALYDSNGLAGGGGVRGSTQGANGTNGGNGYGSMTWDAYYGGNGGGGGASSVTGNGGNGGSGGVGAGGGGGGSCLVGFTPGLGGAGGNGYVKVTTYK